MWSLNHLHRPICPEVPKIQTTHAGGPSPCLDYQRIFQRNYWHSVFFVDHKRMLKSRQGKKTIKNVIPLNLIFCFLSMYILATYKPCQTDGEKKQITKIHYKIIRVQNEHCKTTEFRKHLNVTDHGSSAEMYIQAPRDKAWHLSQKSPFCTQQFENLWLNVFVSLLSELLHQFVVSWTQ